MTKITVDQLLEAARDAGCTVEEQKKFFKITAPGGNRKAVYVGRAKRVVTRVDIAGFEPADHPAIYPLTKDDAKDLNLGAVRGQILPQRDEENTTDEMVTEAFQVCLADLLSAEEGFKFAPKAKEEGEEAQAADAPTAE